MSERKYISGTMKDPSGKVIAERTFKKPHTNIWAAMTELANSSKKAPQP